LESNTVQGSDTQSSHILHTIHAHLLSYASLLRDFKKSVQFVLETPNPAIHHSSTQKRRLEIECNHLIDEIERLQMERETHTERLKNATNLLFSRINLQDSNEMRHLTAVAVRDSRAMKQVSILTMIFLPASFSATVFGMNIQSLSSDPNIKGTLAHYVATAISLTAITVWVIVASQRNAPGSHKDTRGWQRMAWPITCLKRILWPWPGKNARDYYGRYEDDHSEMEGAGTFRSRV